MPPVAAFTRRNMSRPTPRWLPNSCASWPEPAGAGRSVPRVLPPRVQAASPRPRSRCFDPVLAVPELSPLAAYGLYDGSRPPRASSPSWDGQRPRVAWSSPTTRRQGRHLLPVTVKNTCGPQKSALHNRLPCLYLVDAGRAFPSCCRNRSSPTVYHFGRSLLQTRRHCPRRGFSQIAAVLVRSRRVAYVPR